MRSYATMSGCGTYRYLLSRQWGEGRLLPFVMLNPSTADARVDDPTIRRCMAFAKRDGFGGIVVANLYALRSTDPKLLTRFAGDPVGPMNMVHLSWLAQSHSNIVCAWGANADSGRAQAVVSILRQGGATLWCLGTTGDGSPRHPLYVRGDQPLVPYSGAR